MSGLSDQPQEILVRIFRCLNQRDVFSCSRVNSKFHQIIEQNRHKLTRKFAQNLEIIQDLNGFEIDNSVKHKWRFVVNSVSTTYFVDKDNLSQFKQYLCDTANLSGINLDSEFPSISTTDVDSCLHELIYYYLSHMIPRRLLLANLTTNQLHKVNEALATCNIELKSLFININEPLEKESLSLLNFVVSELVINSQLAQHIPVKTILAMELVQKVTSISLQCFQSDGPVDNVSDLFVQLRATTIRLPKCYPISSDTFRNYIKELLYEGRSLVRCHVFIEYSGHKLQELLQGLDYHITPDSRGYEILSVPSYKSRWVQFRKIDCSLFYAEIW